MELVSHSEGTSSLAKVFGISGLILLSIPLITFENAVGVVPLANTASSCTNSTIDAMVLDSKIPFSQQSARILTESSAAFLNAIRGFAVIFGGIGNEWNFNSAACRVSWDSFALTYELKAANGSQFTLSLGANPGTNSVFGAKIRPLAIYSLPINQSSTTYSGYALAANSNYNSEVNYTTAEWYIPTVSAPTQQNCGNNAFSTPRMCELAVWIGLQNSTYDGTNHVVAHGEVIQTGTEGDCPTSCSSPGYTGWSEYVNGNSNGVVQQVTHLCNSHFTAAAGDFMYGVVGSQEVINGTTGNTFYTELRDFSNGTICEFAYLNNSTSCGASPCRIAGKEYFADYFAETPEAGSVPYMLPKFTLSSGTDFFYNMGMISTTIGSYSYYNSGYYLTSHMENGGTVNTKVSIMYKNSGTYYAYFDETWKDSSHTGGS